MFVCVIMWVFVFLHWFRTDLALNCVCMCDTENGLFQIEAISDISIKFQNGATTSVKRGKEMGKERGQEE